MQNQLPCELVRWSTRDSHGANCVLHRSQAEKAKQHVTGALGKMKNSMHKGIVERQIAAVPSMQMVRMNGWHLLCLAGSLRWSLERRRLTTEPRWMHWLQQQEHRPSRRSKKQSRQR